MSDLYRRLLTGLTEKFGGSIDDANADAIAYAAAELYHKDFEPRLWQEKSAHDLLDLFGIPRAGSFSPYSLSDRLLLFQRRSGQAQYVTRAHELLTSLGVPRQDENGVDQPLKWRLDQFILSVNGALERAAEAEAETAATDEPEAAAEVEVEAEDEAEEATAVEDVSEEEDANGQDVTAAAASDTETTAEATAEPVAAADPSSDGEARATDTAGASPAAEELAEAVAEAVAEAISKPKPDAREAAEESPERDGQKHEAPPAADTGLAPPADTGLAPPADTPPAETSPVDTGVTPPVEAPETPGAERLQDNGQATDPGASPAELVEAVRALEEVAKVEAELSEAPEGVDLARLSDTLNAMQADLVLIREMVEALELGVRDRLDSLQAQVDALSGAAPPAPTSTDPAVPAAILETRDLPPVPAEPEVGEGRARRSLRRVLLVVMLILLGVLLAGGILLVAAVGWDELRAQVGAILLGL